jgi:SAM-dependent methyltransferase
LGVVGRASNFEKCRLVEGYFELPNLRFLHLDVRRLDPEKHGRFDVVLCCGLLYHLADPFSFISRLRRLTVDDGVLFFDTHVAPVTDEALARCRLREQLSDLETWPMEGMELEGRWSREFLTPLGKDEPWDSIAESRSFWPTREALFECLYRNRFDFIADLYGTFDPAADRVLRREFSRIYCVATRGGRESLR